MTRDVHFYRTVSLIIVVLLMIAAGILLLPPSSEETEVELPPEGYETKPEFQAEYDDVYHAVLARNPEIVPVSRNVPDEENGLLQFLDLCDRLAAERGEDMQGRGIGFPEELNEVISYPDKWDREIYGKHIVEYSDLIEELTIIGLMPRRSSASFPVSRLHYMDTSVILDSVRLLLSNARLAAEDGNHDKALIALRAAKGISTHMGDLEFSSLIMEQMADRLANDIQSAAIEYIFIELNFKKEDFLRWRNILFKDSRVTSERVQKMILGECVVSLRNYMIPALIHASEYEAGNLERFCDRFVQACLEMTNNVVNLDDEALYLASTNKSLRDATVNLTEDQKDFTIMINSTFEGYIQLMVKSSVISAFNYAAMSVMAGEAVPIEKITGKPYVFDENANTLSLPEDNLLDLFQLEPIKLP